VTSELGGWKMQSQELITAENYRWQLVVDTPH
jgi:hypothetical protein